MKLRKSLVVLGLAGVLTAVVVAGTAFAQTPTPTPGQQTRANYQEFFLDRLASALGVARDKLNSAITQARNETVDQLVKDGKLTQQQADAIKAQPGNGFFGVHGFDRDGRGGPGMPGGQHIDAIAQALGMSTQDLMTQLRAGKTLAELAVGKEQAVKDAIVAAEKARLDPAVAAGRITQEQENQILDRIRNSDLSQLGGFGGRGGPRGGEMRKPAPSSTPGTGSTTGTTSMRTNVL